jgi:diguanylate cyclase (GGDEF)-like protein
MSVRSRLDVLFFVLLIALAAAAINSLIHFLILPVDQFLATVRAEATTAAVCALPLAWFGASRLRLANRLKDRLEILAHHDPLTGLMNRGRFLDRMQEIPVPTGVVALFDIDHFKAVNDRFGHLAGDRALRHVAGVLGAACRPGDLICRFGGEEFAVLFAGCTPDQGRLRAERMAAAVAAEPVVIDGTVLGLTVSAGCARRGDGDDLTAALRAADVALYRAKTTGRARVVAAPDRRFPALRPAA